MRSSGFLAGCREGVSPSHPDIIQPRSRSNCPVFQFPNIYDHAVALA
jgi:hypothetical protein